MKKWIKEGVNAYFCADIQTQSLLIPTLYSSWISPHISSVITSLEKVSTDFPD